MLSPLRKLLAKVMDDPEKNGHYYILGFRSGFEAGTRAAELKVRKNSLTERIKELPPRIG